MNTELKTTWYEDLGFEFNPFTIKPGLFSLHGRNDIVEQVKSTILSGKNCILEGTYGSGKTSMLQELIDEYKGKRKVVYFACNRLKSELDVDKILLDRTIVNKLFHIKAKNMILLLDEAEHLCEKDVKRILEHHKKGYFKSVLFITHDTKKLDLDFPIYNFSKIEPDYVLGIVKDRIGESKLLPDDVALKIYSKSKSMRHFLKTCEQFMKAMHEAGKKKATVKDISTVF